MFSIYEICSLLHVYGPCQNILTPYMYKVGHTHVHKHRNVQINILYILLYSLRNKKED